MRKETFNNWYRLRTYFIAHMVVTTPIQIVLGISFSAIVYWLTDQQPELGRLVRFMAVFVLLTIAGDSLGLAIGAFVGSPVVSEKWAGVVAIEWGVLRAFC